VRVATPRPPNVWRHPLVERTNASLGDLDAKKDSLRPLSLGGIRHLFVDHPLQARNFLCVVDLALQSRNLLCVLLLEHLLESFLLLEEFVVEFPLKGDVLVLLLQPIHFLPEDSVGACKFIPLVLQLSVDRARNLVENVEKLGIHW